MSDKKDADTVEFQMPSPAERLNPPKPFSSLVQVDIGGLSHRGKVRPNNEDHFLTARFGRFLEPLQSNLPPDDIPRRSEECGYGMVVADGIGGRAAGEVASKMAITTLMNLVLHTPDWILRQPDDYFMQQVQRRTTERFADINATLTEQAEIDPKLHGFGTTMTLAVSLGRDLLVGHVGDSRAYLFRDGKLVQLTADHTMAQVMANEGIIAQSDVAKHHMRHVLTQSLGVTDREVVTEIHQITLQHRDCVLLCTDGLTDMVSPIRIATLLNSAQPVSDICYALVDEALSAGGKDNVTVVVARYRLPSN